MFSKSNSIQRMFSQGVKPQEIMKLPVPRLHPLQVTLFQSQKQNTGAAVLENRIFPNTLLLPCKQNCGSDCRLSAASIAEASVRTPPKGQAAEQQDSLQCWMLSVYVSDNGNSYHCCYTFQSRRSSTPNAENPKPNGVTGVEMYGSNLQSAAHRADLFHLLVEH